MYTCNINKENYKVFSYIGSQLKTETRKTRRTSARKKLRCGLKSIIR